MNIEIKGSWSGKDIVYTAENVKIEENVLERIYEKDENGKTNFSKLKVEDITDEALEQFTQLTEELLYYRKRDFDTSELICQAFNKLPQEKIKAILEQLNKDYGE
jgi:hypothetical protein|nr:MAG TPA: hypothetical protein [Caudoviricetes sp.]